MSRLLVLARLAGRDLRRRLTETLLLLAALTMAATTLTVALLLHGQTGAPYATTRAQTAGPDLVATLFAAEGATTAPDPAPLDALTARPEVTGHSPAFPTTWPVIEAGGVRAVAEVQGRPVGDSPVDRPRVVAGHWLDGDQGVVVERAFAQALGLHSGDTVTLDDRTVRVIGIAVSAALPPYPQLCTVGCALGGPKDPNQVGLVWATSDRATAFTSAKRPVAYFEYFQLHDPGSAPSFALQNAVDPALGGQFVDLEPWQQIAHRYDEQLSNERTVVIFGSTLLVVLALATLVVLVGGRMADDSRRIGTLKAAGATPGFVVRLLLASYLTIGLVAAGAGLVVGRLLAPRLVPSSAGLLGHLGPTRLAPSDVVVVVAAALAVVLTASLVPGWRAARTSTVRALVDAGRTPHRSKLVLRLSARLPPPALIGFRLAARRPRRTLLTTVAIAVAVCGSTGALYATAALGRDHAQAGGPVDPDVAQLHTVTLVIVLLLALMAALTLVFVSRTSAVDARRVLAIIRALGTTPSQAAAALSVAQLVPAIGGVVLGGAAGVVVIHWLSDDVVRPPWWQLTALAALTVLTVTALTTLPARLEARRPVAATLRHS